MSARRAGSRQTEVGLIPTDWEVAEISAVGPIQTGPFGTILKAGEYSNGEGVPLISVGEIHFDGIRLRSDTPKVDTHVVRRLPQFVVREGDILFGRKGAVDRSAVVGRKEGGWFLGSDGLRLRPDRTYSSAYLGYQFQSNRIRHWLIENSVGTTMPSMNEAVLRKVQFAIPPTKNEQVAIANALSDADGLIAALEALIAKKRDIKQGALQELLTGQRRLPGFKGDWVTKQVGSIFDFGRTVPLSRAQLSPDAEVRYVHYGDIHTRLHDHLDFEQKSTPTAAERLCSTATPLQVGDWIFADASEDYDGLAKAVEVTGLSSKKAVAGLHTFMLRERVKTFSLGFKGYLSHAPSFRAQVIRAATGTKVYGIAKTQMSAVELFFPPILDEQRAIAAILSDIDAEISTLEQKLAKARAVKQGMMQVLLTGEVRLV
jgi:type I restriction enzyme S subunit